jgi:hypothetical protein
MTGSTAADDAGVCRCRQARQTDSIADFHNPAVDRMDLPVKSIY